MARNVGGFTWAGAAAANTAAKNAMDFGLAMFVAMPARNDCHAVGPPSSNRAALVRPAFTMSRPPNQMRYAAPATFTASAIHGNVAKTMPTPRMEQVAQNRF